MRFRVCPSTDARVANAIANTYLRGPIICIVSMQCRSPGLDLRPEPRRLARQRFAGIDYDLKRIAMHNVIRIIDARFSFLLLICSTIFE